MNDRIRWINHKGVDILYMDYSGLSEDEFVAMMLEIEAMLKDHPIDCFMPFLANVTNAHVTAKTAKVGRKISKTYERFTKGKAYAVVGVTGVQKVIARSFASTWYFARNEEDAKEYLVKAVQKHRVS